MIFEISPESKGALHERLLEWYDTQARDLPWRNSNDPYAIWMSEIMLQQTKVATVIPYFERWMARFPTVEALAAAPLDAVLKAWEGLGYYARARNLHRAAQLVVSDYDGQLPHTVKELLKLPGIGQYTAGAIASIAFGEPAPALDGNLKRVFARLTSLEEPINRRAGEKELWAIAEALLPEERVGEWNQALMDLGATICISRTPRCLLCPLRGLCDAQKKGLQSSIPIKIARRPRPHYTVTAGIIWDEAHERILIAQRPTDKMLGGLWEFPGGKCEPKESLHACLQRELREELAIEVEVGDLVTVIKHGYTHFTITLHAFHCTYRTGTPTALEVADFRWVTMAELDRFPWPKTDLQIIEALRKG
ncbi:MAG: A/G-specific adenine glycosylase [Ardenticatenaceae bacterium]